MIWISTRTLEIILDLRIDKGNTYVERENSENSDGKKIRRTLFLSFTDSIGQTLSIRLRASEYLRMVITRKTSLRSTWGWTGPEKSSSLDNN